MYITILVKQVYWYISQVSGERLQDHWSSGLISFGINILLISLCGIEMVRPQLRVTNSSLGYSGHFDTLSLHMTVATTNLGPVFQNFVSLTLSLSPQFVNYISTSKEFFFVE